MRKTAFYITPGRKRKQYQINNKPDRLVKVIAAPVSVAVRKRPALYALIVQIFPFCICHHVPARSLAAAKCAGGVEVNAVRRFRIRDGTRNAFDQRIFIYYAGTQKEAISN